MVNKINISSLNDLQSKLAVFVHHRGASALPMVNLDNFQELLPLAINHVVELGVKNISIPFTHVDSFDSEFITTIQFLTDTALARGLTVMLVANGNLNVLSADEIVDDSEKYMDTLVEFATRNTGKGLIYNGINEIENGAWYGDKSNNGLIASINWNNKLFDNIRLVDDSATFVAGSTEIERLTWAINNTNIKGDFLSVHPYMTKLGDKGNNTPENQILNPQYTLSYNGKSYIAGEFGISGYVEKGTNESDWQGMVDAKLAGGLLVRQIIIQDYLKMPMQYAFMLGYYYDFKKFQFFDINGNITPTGSAIKQLMAELGMYHFEKWVYANVGENSLYIAKYIANNQPDKYVYWSAISDNVTEMVNGINLTFNKIPQYTEETLIGNIQPFTLVTPIGINSINPSLLNIGNVTELVPPNVDGYVANNAYVSVDKNGNTSLLNNITYHKTSASDENTASNMVFGVNRKRYIKSPNGETWIKYINNDGKPVYEKR